MNTKNIIHITRKIIHLLVEGKFEELFLEDVHKAIHPAAMQTAIAEYGGILTFPPEEEFSKFDLYAVSENECSIDFDLWINEEKSDLTLSCSIYHNGEGIYTYSIDNIHVL